MPENMAHGRRHLPAGSPMMDNGSRSGSPAFTGGDQHKRKKMAVITVGFIQPMCSLFAWHATISLAWPRGIVCPLGQGAYSLGMQTVGLTM